MPPVCYPGSPDPRCPQPDRPASTNPPVAYLPPVFTKRESKCDANSTDPSCSNKITDNSLIRFNNESRNGQSSGGESSAKKYYSKKDIRDALEALKRELQNDVDFNDTELDVLQDEVLQEVNEARRRRRGT